ncbi:MAG: hypothetical protein D6714_12375 [Bacteroidetes bacterium]|nr:MAG: hypothetical protein D6714_12375 [Bacteroidota bacterium]
MSYQRQYLFFVWKRYFYPKEPPFNHQNENIMTLRFTLILCLLAALARPGLAQTKAELIQCLEQVFQTPEMGTVIQRKQLESDVIYVERKFKLDYTRRRESEIALQFEKSDFWNFPIEIQLRTQSEMKELNIKPTDILNWSFQFEDTGILVLISTSFPERPTFFTGQYFFEKQGGTWVMTSQKHQFR